MQARIAPIAAMVALALALIGAMGATGGGSAIVTPRAIAQVATPVAAEAFRPTHVVNPSQSMNLQAEPTTASPILAVLSPGEPVASLGEAVTDAEGEAWLNVATDGGLVGWVRASDLDPIDEAGASGSDATDSPPGSGPTTGATDLIVGAWAERRNRGNHVIFHADGTALLTDATGQTFHGAWRPVDHRDLVGTYVFQAWGRGGGTGRAGPILRVNADELELGDTVYDRLVPPAPEEFARPGVDGSQRAVPRPTDPPAADAGSSPAPAATPLAGSASAVDTPVAGSVATANEPSPGVAVEDLADVTELPGRLPLGQVALTRATLRPGAAFAYPFPYPVLVAVEAGTLTVDAIGRGVTVTSPPETIEGGQRRQPVQAEGEGITIREAGGVTTRQRFSELSPGGTASVRAGGSVFGEANGIGALRNDGDEPLVLLLVALGPEGRRWAVTREGTARPADGRRDAISVEDRRDAVIVEDRRAGVAVDDQRGFVVAEARRGAEVPADPADERRPAPCRVEPRTQAEVERIVSETGPGPGAAASAADLPAGEPADRATVAAIVALERELAGCLNAFDYPRWLALQTAGAVAESVAPGEVADLFAGVGDPAVYFGEGAAADVPGIAGVVVRDVGLLRDGRVGAVVEWRGPTGHGGRPRGDSFVVADETVFRTYTEVDGRWLIDGELAVDA